MEKIKDLNEFLELIKKSEVVVNNELDYFIDSSKEFASYSLSEVRLKDYELRFSNLVDVDKNGISMGYLIKGISVDYSIGSSNLNEDIDMYYSLLKDEDYIKLEKNMFVILGLANLCFKKDNNEIKTIINEFVENVNKMYEKINEFQEFLVKNGATSPILINYTKNEEIKEDILINLISYVNNEKTKNVNFDFQEENNVIAALSPIGIDVKLNFSSNNEEKYYKYIVDLFKLYMELNEDYLSKYLFENNTAMKEWREFALISINKEKENKQKKKL